MIFDKLERLSVYFDSVPYLREICEELSGKDFSSIEIGTYYTEKSHVKYMVQSYETQECKKPEVHKKYADLQLVISGKERFDFASVSPLPESFKEVDDIGFYADDLSSSLVLGEGEAVIVFPYEPHTPGLTADTAAVMKKIVAKIPIE